MNGSNFRAYPLSEKTDFTELDPYQKTKRHDQWNRKKLQTLSSRIF